MLKRIGFAGTFDPITKGHLWVIGEAEQLADEVIILIAHNQSKQTMFSIEQRKHIIEQSLLEEGFLKSKVEIVYNEYTATYAKQNNIDYLIRGIRSTVDFDYENVLQQANTSVLQGAKTLFVMPPRDLGSVSSSFVKSLIGPKGWQFYVKQFLTESVFDAIAYEWLKHKYKHMSSDYLNILFNEKNYNILTMDLIQVVTDIEELTISNSDYIELLKEYYLFKEILHIYDNNIFENSEQASLVTSTFDIQSINQSEYITTYLKTTTQLKDLNERLTLINIFIEQHATLINMINDKHAKSIITHYK